MMPAARVGDMCVCTGPPDVIAKGSPTVLIGGMMAARVGDLTVHGGVIVMGCPTVMIGEAGSGGGGGGGGAGGPGGAGAAGGAGGAGAGAPPDPYSTKYPTAEAAAIAAMQDANPKSKAKNLEMGGWIQKNPDGTFTPRPPVTGSPAGLDNMPAKQSDDVAWWHTHGAYDPKYDNENFSGATGDKGYSKANNAPGYVATPSGAIKKYDPATDTVTTLPDKTK
jgi:hypothetical protein